VWKCFSDKQMVNISRKSSIVATLTVINSEILYFSPNANYKLSMLKFFCKYYCNNSKNLFDIFMLVT